MSIVDRDSDPLAVSAHSFGNRYIEELLALQHVLFYLQDALVALLLWRGTTTITIGKTVLKLPIHSLTAFVVAATLVERPQLLPSVILFGLAWMLLAIMDYRLQLPDIWSRCKSFSELARTLVLGESGVPPDNIPPGANYEEAQRFHEEWKKRIANAEDAAVKAYEESMKLQEEYLQEMDEVDEGDPDLATRDAGLSIDPFKPLLFPVQQNLAMVSIKRFLQGISGRCYSHTDYFFLDPVGLSLREVYEVRTFLGRVLYLVLGCEWLSTFVFDIPLRPVVLLNQVVSSFGCVGTFWSMDEACRYLLREQGGTFNRTRCGCHKERERKGEEGNF
jgi:hypothetical protein